MHLCLPGLLKAPDLAVCGAENRCRIESRSPKCGGSKAKNELCCPRAAGNRKSWPLLPGGRGGVGGADQDGTWAPRTGPLDGCDASWPLTRAATRLLSAGHGNRPGLRSEATWVLEGRGGGSLDLQDGQVNVPRPHRRKIMPTNFKRRCALKLRGVPSSSPFPPSPPPRAPLPLGPRALSASAPLCSCVPSRTSPFPLRGFSTLLEAPSPSRLLPALGLLVSWIRGAIFCSVAFLPPPAPGPRRTLDGRATGSLLSPGAVAPGGDRGSG